VRQGAWHSSYTDFNPKTIITAQLLCKQASSHLQDTSTTQISSKINVCHMYLYPRCIIKPNKIKKIVASAKIMYDCAPTPRHVSKYRQDATCRSPLFVFLPVQKTTEILLRNATHVLSTPTTYWSPESFIPVITKI
jgi:hypothetical protein